MKTRAEYQERVRSIPKLQIYVGFAWLILIPLGIWKLIELIISIFKFIIGG